MFKKLFEIEGKKIDNGGDKKNRNIDKREEERRQRKNEC